MGAGMEAEDARLRPLIEAFYERVRADPDLGPVFMGAVSDWDDHHRRLVDFWLSVAFGVARYKGNPVALHMRHAAEMTPAHFERWLALWRDTTNRRLPAPMARALQAKAERIAQTLRNALFDRPPPTPFPLVHEGA